MRALIKKNDANSFVIDVDFVHFEEVLGKGNVQLNTSNGVIFVTVPIDELESIRVKMLRDGYFDFRKNPVKLGYFEG